MFMKKLSLLLTVIFFTSTIPNLSYGAVITTHELVSYETMQMKRQDVNIFLQRKDIQNNLEQMGIDSQEVVARVDSLSDQEILNIHGQMEKMPVGANALGVVVGAALLIFIVLLITDIAGLTNVFNFTKKAK